MLLISSKLDIATGNKSEINPSSKISKESFIFDMEVATPNNLKLGGGRTLKLSWRDNEYSYHSHLISKDMEYEIGILKPLDME
jgi:hypothetical protein